jgi:hypothetical protein
MPIALKRKITVIMLLKVEGLVRQLKWQCHLARIGTAMELLTSVEDQEEGD